MPPSISDGYVMLKPRDDGRIRRSPRPTLVTEIEKARRGDPRQATTNFPQPIQLRFNELISGVRSDVGVKIFGDDLDTLIRGRRAGPVRPASRARRGRRKTEQVAGLPVLTVKLNRPALVALRHQRRRCSERSWRSPSAASRPALCSRATAASTWSCGCPSICASISTPSGRFRSRCRAAEQPAAAVRAAAWDNSPLAQVRYVPLSAVADIEIAPGPNQISRENGKRRIVVSCQRARARSRLLRRRCAAADRREGQTAGWLLDRLGRSVRAAGVRHQAADDRGPDRSAADLPAAVHEPGIGCRCSSRLQRRSAWRLPAALPRCCCAASRSRSARALASSPCRASPY